MINDLFQFHIFILTKEANQIYNVLSIEFPREFHPIDLTGYFSRTFIYSLVSVIKFENKN